MVRESQFILRSKVYFNKQSIRLLAELSGNRTLLVSDGVMEELGYLQQARELLQRNGGEVAVFTGVRPDPDVAVVAAGLQAYQACNPDVLVALGGGSAIDTAKGILYSARQMQPNDAPFQKPLFVAIPSTSGTGSEVTDFSVITCEAEKICLVDELLAPDIAILDSTCIRHVPQKVVADTGIDVLVHALEAYVSTKATDFTDALAEKAAELVLGHLPTLYKDPANSDARDRIQNASCMAGMAFTNANLGINHSLAHALGSVFHLPHGRANALLMEAVIEYNANLPGKDAGTAMEKYGRLARALGLPARTQREGVSSLLGAVRRLKAALNIETGVERFDIGHSEYTNASRQMAEMALRDRCTPTNPRQPTLEELVEIYQKSYYGNR